MFFIFLSGFLKIVQKVSPYTNFNVFNVIASLSKFKLYPMLSFKSCYSYGKTCQAFLKDIGYTEFCSLLVVLPIII